MKKQFVAYAFTTFMALQVPADAAIVTVLPAGQLSNGGTVATFDGVPQTPYGSTTAAGPFTDGGAAFSGTGLIMNNPGQPSAFYAQPLHTTSNESSGPRNPSSMTSVRPASPNASPDR